jgi:hypothetical protein
VTGPDTQRSTKPDRLPGSAPTEELKTYSYPQLRSKRDAHRSAWAEKVS